MTKHVTAIVNSFDPQDKLWQNTAVSLDIDTEEAKVSSHSHAAPYMKAMDGWVFALRTIGSQSGIDLPEYAVYDDNSLEFHPLSMSDFNAMKEI